MTISITRTDVAPFLGLIRKLLLDYLIPHTKRQLRDQVIYHMEWLGRQKGDMQMGLVLDTESKPNVTRIVIEIGYDNLAPTQVQ